MPLLSIKTNNLQQPKRLSRFHSNKSSNRKSQFNLIKELGTRYIKYCESNDFGHSEISNDDLVTLKRHLDTLISKKKINSANPEDFKSNFTAALSWFDHLRMEFAEYHIPYTEILALAKSENPSKHIQDRINAGLIKKKPQ